jgi:hypothetical protein
MNLERVMLLDGSNIEWGGGGGPEGAWCRSCRQPIGKDEQKTHVFFPTDPHGFKGLSGDYHAVCSKPFASMARAMQALDRRIN